MVIGLNPSTANAEKNDNTINILITALTALGYGGLRMVNLYSLITPHPADLFNCPDPQKGNDAWIATNAFISQEIIFAWGNFKGIEHRAKKLVKDYPDALCFGKNKNGSPWHPRAMSYIKGFKMTEAKLTRFSKTANPANYLKVVEE